MDIPFFQFDAGTNEMNFPLAFVITYMFVKCGAISSLKKRRGRSKGNLSSGCMPVIKTCLVQEKDMLLAGPGRALQSAWVWWPGRTGGRQVNLHRKKLFLLLFYCCAECWLLFFFLLCGAC